MKKSEEGKEAPMQGALLSTEDGAQIKGVTVQAIVAAIRRGAIPATKVGRDYVIRSEDLEGYQPTRTQAERARRPRPSRKKDAAE